MVNTYQVEYQKVVTVQDDHVFISSIPAQPVVYSRHKKTLLALSESPVTVLHIFFQSPRGFFELGGTISFLLEKDRCYWVVSTIVSSQKDEQSVLDFERYSKRSMTVEAGSINSMRMISFPSTKNNNCPHTLRKSSGKEIKYYSNSMTAYSCETVLDSKELMLGISNEREEYLEMRVFCRPEGSFYYAGKIHIERLTHDTTQWRFFPLYGSSDKVDLLQYFIRQNPHIFPREEFNSPFILHSYLP